MKNLIRVLIVVGCILVVGYLFLYLFRPMKNNLDLLREANKKVKEKDSTAFVYFQEGKVAGRDIFNAPRETNEWIFLAHTDDLKGMTCYFNGQEWKIEEGSDRWIGDPKAIVDLIKLVKMELNEAWALVERREDVGPLSAWELYLPLRRRDGNPAYVFHTSKKTISVDSVTGKIE